MRPIEANFTKYTLGFISNRSGLKHFNYPLNSLKKNFKKPKVPLQLQMSFQITVDVYIVGVMCCAESLTTPVIHQYHAKDVFMGFLDGNGLSELIPSSNKEGLLRRETQFEIQQQ